MLRSKFQPIVTLPVDSREVPIALNILPYECPKVTLCRIRGRMAAGGRKDVGSRRERRRRGKSTEGINLALAEIEGHLLA